MNNVRSLREIREYCEGELRSRGEMPQECLCNLPQGVVGKEAPAIEIPLICWNPFCTRRSLMTTLQRSMFDKCNINMCVMNVENIDLSGGVSLTIDNRCQSLDRGEPAAVPSPPGEAEWSLRPRIALCLLLLCLSLLRV